MFDQSDSGFFTLARNIDIEGFQYPLFYACVHEAGPPGSKPKSDGYSALCTSVDSGNEEGPILKMDMNVDKDCTVSSFESYERDLAGPKDSGPEALVGTGIYYSMRQ